MTQDVDLATLNTTQLVLRGLTVSLAAASHVEPAKLASLLQAFAATYAGGDSIAERMLLDLAEGLDTLAKGRPQ